MEQNIMYGEAKAQQTKSYGNFEGKYFIYLPTKRLEGIGGKKGYKIAYRIEVLGVSDSQPRGKFKEAKEGNSSLKKKMIELVENPQWHK